MENQLENYTEAGITKGVPNVGLCGGDISLMVTPLLEANGERVYEDSSLDRALLGFQVSLEKLGNEGAWRQLMVWEILKIILFACF